MRTAKNMSCSKIIRRRRREAETRNGYIQLLARIILVIVCGGLLFTQGFLLMRAPDNGMFPAIKGGDLLIGFRLQRNFLKNDVVVYKANGKLQVGRILGQETDVITIDDTGQLLVNGTPQTGEIAFPTYAKKGIKKYPYRVVCIPSSRQLKKYKIFVLPGWISGNIFMPPIVAFHEIPLVLRLQVLSVAGRLYSNLYIL